MGTCWVGTRDGHHDHCVRPAGTVARRYCQGRMGDLLPCADGLHLGRGGTAHGACGGLEASDCEDTPEPVSVVYAMMYFYFTPQGQTRA
jgi:hypothetical protein